MKQITEIMLIDFYKRIKATKHEYKAGRLSYDEAEKLMIHDAVWIFADAGNGIPAPGSFEARHITDAVRSVFELID